MKKKYIVSEMYECSGCSPFYDFFYERKFPFCAGQTDELLNELYERKSKNRMYKVEKKECEIRNRRIRSIVPLRHSTDGNSFSFIFNNYKVSFLLNYYY